MRLTEPILFPIVIYPLDVFRFAGKHNIQNFDVLSNYGYQSHHLTLVNRYIDSELMENFVNILANSQFNGYYDTESFVEYIDTYIGEEKEVYEYYYRYFLTKFILESNSYEHSIDELIDWLDRDINYIFKKCSTYNKKTTLTEYYNTIVIPRIWDKVQLNNMTWINKMYRLLPISFNQSKVIKQAGEHLMEGGKMYVLRPEDYGAVFWDLGDDFDVNMEEEPWCFTKKEAPKKSKTNEINWL